MIFGLWSKSKHVKANSALMIKHVVQPKNSNTNRENFNTDIIDQTLKATNRCILYKLKDVNEVYTQEFVCFTV